ncbi:MAG: T9SS type A sorting domain-containing protein [Bacteroidetes bacterium]|nr:T9SS type A sorting domain-containing protein [Bacteroidota bacterium]
MKGFFSLLLCCLTVAGHGQHRQCGSMEVLAQMLRDNPAIATARQDIEAQTVRFISSHPFGASSRSIITIPVVVHVVYSTADQNISDAQIQSQIDVLNADYNQSNSNWSSTPPVFQSVSGSMGIQFCLARRDPAGNATNGIVRTSTAATIFSTSNTVKYTAQGGDDAWPAASYLNLWVCNLGNALLGYAQFPGGASETDGVVINYTAFGNTGTVLTPYDKGRTATHEIGHWMNLYHIWGNTSGDCSGTDHVDDTPPQYSENFGCPSFPHVSCTNAPDGDMFMNFMDYTDDACMTMFTAGQALRAQALFATGGARASIASSAGCVPPASGTAACSAPDALTSGIVASPTDTIQWSAVSGATSYILEYRPSASSQWANATTSAPAKYLTGLVPGTTYQYHVSAVCPTGSSAYSAIRSFTTQGSSTGISDMGVQIEYTIYPNPTHGKFQLMISASDPVDKISVRITDMLGHTVHDEDFTHINGLYSYQIDLTGVATGVYNVSISDGVRTEVRKVIVQ